MRLCFIADAESVHTRKWANYFARNGHEVHLISRFSRPHYEELDNRIHLHNLIRILPISQVSSLSIWTSAVFWLFQVRYLIWRIKPDILHAHFIGVPGYLAANAGFHPLVLTAWGSDVLIIPKENPAYRVLTKQALRCTDRIICVSVALKQEIEKLGAESSKVEVIHIGIDVQRFNSSLRNKALLKDYDMDDKPVVISTRNLERIYDIETLIKAVPMVLKEIPEARFLIGGKGKQRVYLENIVRTLGISNSVKFVGWIPEKDLPNYLASSDVYVSTSLSDGTSVSLLEALSSGLAPVVTDIPANRPWISNGSNGFLVPVGNYKILAGKIILLLKDEQTRVSFGKMGRDAVIERADYENEMAKVVIIYEELRHAKPRLCK